MDRYIKADYHTHTVNSHGKGTIEENVVKAIERGMEVIAITDHGFGQPFAGITPKKFESMKEQVAALREKYKNIKIMLGVEANIINKKGDVDLTEEQIKEMDIILSGYHLTATEWKMPALFNMVCPALLWKMGHISKAQIEKNTKTYLDMLDRYPIDVVTHPGYLLSLDYKTFGKACAELGTYVEISTRHEMPSKEGLLELLDTDCKFIINSDAHELDQIGRVDYALNLIEELKIQDRVVNYNSSEIKLRSKS